MNCPKSGMILENKVCKYFKDGSQATATYFWGMTHCVSSVIELVNISFSAQPRPLFWFRFQYRNRNSKTSTYSKKIIVFGDYNELRFVKNCT